jgi:2-dehydro-3-deoxy-D-arabinonate dehydratase
MKLYSTDQGAVLERDGVWLQLPADYDWDALFTAEAPLAWLESQATRATPIAQLGRLLSLPKSQEVWAAGVTYQRSRVARVAESKQAGGGTFYDKVYDAERPELFFKASPARVAASGEPVRIRRDSRWNVPEPELALVIDSRGRILGYTIGNDMSSRDIEGENPLYLPQAKVYHRSAALGPGIWLAETPLAPDTTISIEIRRGSGVVFQGTTTISQIKRSFAELVEFLFREDIFPTGCFLMTGTGIVPPDDFTLAGGDEIAITIPPIGTLINTVAPAA